MATAKEHGHVRFSFYRLFTCEKFSYLGCGNRMKLPDCAAIKEHFQR
jgi:hypothetical protein